MPSAATTPDESAVAGQLVTQTVQWLRGHLGTHANLQTDSRQVKQGDAFLAYSGAKHDGRIFIDQAMAQGAAAVLYETTQLPEILQTEGAVPCLGVYQLKQYLADIAAQYYEYPARHLKVVAITGTNGKTSCAYWVSSALCALGLRSGFIGTIGAGWPDQVMARSITADIEQTNLTTPDAVELQSKLAGFRQQQAYAVALEASSIGIEQGRLKHTEIAVAAFTNLSRDHLDYHGTMQAYAAAKYRLFDQSGVRSAVVNLDDEYAQVLVERLRGRSGLELITTSARAHPQANISVQKIDIQPSGMQLSIALCLNGLAPQLVVLDTALIGGFNVDNLLIVLGILLALKITPASALQAIAQLQPPPGRLQRIVSKRGAQRLAGDLSPEVIVDYAHTPDALEKSLQVLRGFAQARSGKLICVFGCGGDRDVGKRSLMGSIAADLADQVWLSSDNPRSEDPLAIIADIQAGIRQWPVEGLRIEPDRKRAILLAISQADANDVILLAGKGHETYQEIAGKRLPFSDAQVALYALERFPSYADSQVSLTLTQLASVLHARLDTTMPEDGQKSWLTVCTDSRKLQAGDLFVALRGERFDGHAYLSEIARAGAIAALISQPCEQIRAQYPDKLAGLVLIQVADTRQALGQLAAYWRAQFSLPVIAVTGSNGKTTTKEMIAAILRAEFGADGYLATQGNLNNEIGVPLSLLGLQPHHRCAVIEVGMNHPGEIAQLAVIVQPTIALVNNAQREHQEFMHSIAAVAQENGAIIAALPSGGTAVFPDLDDYTELWQGLLAKGAQAYRFAVVPADLVPADVVPADVESADLGPNRQAHDGVSKTHSASLWCLESSINLRDNFSEFNLELGDRRCRIRLHAIGLHNIHNALAAASACLAAGVSLSAVQAGLNSFRPVYGRMQYRQLAAGITLIDDSYNANPDSVRAAIDVLRQRSGNTVLVLGDMGEVGDQGPAFHREAGLYAQAAGISHLLTLGEASSLAVEAVLLNAAHGSKISAQHFLSLDDLLLCLDDLIKVYGLNQNSATQNNATQDSISSSALTILVKGSRFMRMERVVEHCLANTCAQHVWT